MNFQLQLPDLELSGPYLTDFHKPLQKLVQLFQMKYSLNHHMHVVKHLVQCM